MSSKIIIENTVKIDETIAKSLFEAQDHIGEIWKKQSDVMRNKKINLKDDNADFIDCIENEGIQEVLLNNNVKGSIKFCLLEDYSLGDFWGYVFDGNGGMREISGEIKWK